MSLVASILAPVLFSGSLAWTTLREQDVTLENGARLQWRDCGVETDYDVFVACADYYPPDGAGQMYLPVVVFLPELPRAWQWLNEPVLYLHGGPGYPAGLDAGSLEYWRRWMHARGWARPLVIFDQRGAGEGRPLLDCQASRDRAVPLLSKPLSMAQEVAAWDAVLQACYADLKAAGYDLSLYTTDASARDVANIMALLGGHEWNLYGVSYGSRLGLEVMRDHPDRLRSVVLDSVFPPDKEPLISFPELMQDGLQRLFKACAADDACHRWYPALEQNFYSTLARLDRKPLMLESVRADTGETITVAINGQRMLTLTFFALYWWDMVASLPSVMDALHKGQHNALGPVLENYLAWVFDTRFSAGVMHSVYCAEQSPSMDMAAVRQRVKAMPHIGQYLLPLLDSSLCDYWQVPNVGDGYRQPVVSDVPALLLSGEFDPITPPVWAQEAAAQLIGARQIVVPGVSHAVVDSDDCASAIVGRFFDDPQAGLALACRQAWKSIKFVPQQKYTSN